MSLEEPDLVAMEKPQIPESGLPVVKTKASKSSKKQRTSKAKAALRYYGIRFSAMLMPAAS